FEIKDNENVLRIERIRYADKTQICYEVVTVPYYLVKNFSKEDVSTHLYKTLEKRGGFAIGRVTEHISASIANEQDARLLKAKKGEPLITRRQVTQLADGKPFEYTRARYVAERFDFTFAKYTKTRISFNLNGIGVFFYLRSSLILVVEIPGVLGR